MIPLPTIWIAQLFAPKIPEYGQMEIVTHEFLCFVYWISYPKK